jgi:hypothetical protein
MTRRPPEDPDIETTATAAAVLQTDHEQKESASHHGDSSRRQGLPGTCLMNQEGRKIKIERMTALGDKQNKTITPDALYHLTYNRIKTPATIHALSLRAANFSQ